MARWRWNCSATINAADDHPDKDINRAEEADDGMEQMVGTVLNMYLLNLKGTRTIASNQEHSQVNQPSKYIYTTTRQKHIVCCSS